jgi:hypothetical protein
VSPSTLLKGKQPQQRVIGRPKIIVMDSGALCASLGTCRVRSTAPKRCQRRGGF